MTDAVAEKMGTLSVEKQEKLEHDVEKMEKKARKKEETLEKQKMVSPQPGCGSPGSRGKGSA